MNQEDHKRKTVIIGAGAAGMMAACAAARSGASVILLEKNEKAGKKIYITGKGRCNFTNVCDTEDFFASVTRNPRFLYSSVYAFGPQDAVSWFESHGVKTKVERGRRAFPVSDHASDITRCLEREMLRLGVEVRFNTEVKDILITDDEPDGHGNRKRRVRGVICADGKRIMADSVIAATGGMSYPSTGSTGDGFRFARTAGHNVTPLYPSLVPFNVKDEDIPVMQGLSLKNVVFTVYGPDGKKKLFHDMGEMMFTHFGVTGPLVLSASSVAAEALARGQLHSEIDLKSALTDKKLDARILREFEENRNRSVKNAVKGLYPSKMIPVILARAGIDPDMPVHDITGDMRRSLIRHTKHFSMSISSLRGFDEAIITRGGVDVRQIDPSTMESKLVRGLYFAGEVIDVDALTGGYNLQIAWSTGHAAGDAG